MSNGIIRDLIIPEEYARKAKNLMLGAEAIKSLLRGLLEESVKNQREWYDLWHEIDEIVKKQGIEREKDESYNFDPIQSKFVLIKMK